MEFTKADTETLARISRWRRDVRHFQTTPVNEEVLDRLRSRHGLSALGRQLPAVARHPGQRSRVARRRARQLQSLQRGGGQQ